MEYEFITDIDGQLVQICVEVNGHIDSNWQVLEPTFIFIGAFLENGREIVLDFDVASKEIEREKQAIIEEFIRQAYDAQGYP